MKRFIEGRDRDQATLFPERLDEAIEADNPVRVVDAFVDALDLAEIGFDVEPESTGRPGYHPATLLKIYLYGYLNQVQSSRRLERECQRNIEVMWLVGQLTPDFKTIADFRRDNGPAIRKRLPPLRRALPRHASARLKRGRDRRQQVQGGESPREEFHERTIGETDRSHREHHRSAISRSSIARIAGKRSPAFQFLPPKSARLTQGIETLKAQARPPVGDRGADARIRRDANFSHRS